MGGFQNQFSEERSHYAKAACSEAWIPIVPGLSQLRRLKPAGDMNNPDFVQIGETKDLKCVMSIPCEKFPLTRRKRKLWRKRLATLLSRFSPMSSRSLYGSHSTRNHFTTGPLIPSDHFPSHPSLFFYGKLRSLGAYAVRGQTLGSVLAEEG